MNTLLSMSASTEYTSSSISIDQRMTRCGETAKDALYQPAPFLDVVQHRFRLGVIGLHLQCLLKIGNRAPIILFQGLGATTANISIDVLRVKLDHYVVILNG